MSHSSRKRFRQVGLVASPLLQRLEGPRPIDVHDDVELSRQTSGEVVAGTLGLWPVDDADRALEPWTNQRTRDLLVASCRPNAGTPVS